MASTFVRAWGGRVRAQGRPARRRRRGQGPQDRASRIQARAEERSHRRVDGGQCARKKSQWGTLKDSWIPQATRDAIVDYIGHWTKRTELPAKKLLGWLGLAAGKFHQWKARYGRPNAHNARMPRDGWLAAWEQQAILDYHQRNSLEGYRRLTFMMLDEDIVAVSPSSVYRVLKHAGRLDRKWRKPSKKGTGFVQPLAAHEHWHVDVSYLNLGGTFYYLCSLLDGYSRLIVHWEIRERMTERDIETIVQRALEKFPAARPRIISDNGPQFIARDFKEFVRLTGVTHVRTSPYYPQSNGKLERWHGTLKGERFRSAAPANVEEARRVVEAFVAHYNEIRLHSAIGYVTPADKLAGRENEIFAERNRKLEAARNRRCREAAQRCRTAPMPACETEPRERLAGVQGAGNEAPWSPEPTTQPS
ncbi:MAG TPA: IS3 family transposase [Lacunisphaera sp.]|nr:IS3 family transposase [Lacunisphaera sp.]